MSPFVDLRIDAAISGKEDAFAEALAAKEQHWAGAAGKAGDVQPSSRLTLHEVLEDHGADMVDRLMSEHNWSEADFRYAAERLEAAGDPDLRVLAQHMRAFEMYASEASEKEMEQMANTTESMTEFLREAGVPMRQDMARPGNVGRGSRAGVAHEPLSLLRTAAPLSYPDQTRPADDREVRGARDLPLSARILDAAREMAQLANAAKDTRQRKRIAKYASYLRQAYARQLEREDASEVVPADGDANAEMDKIVNDAARDAGNGSGDGDGDHAEFASFDDWDNEDRAGSEDRVVDDVDAQKRAAADDMALDEDVPQGLPPRPGKRIGEDENPGHGDEPLGSRKNAADDDVLQRVRKGSARFGAGQPRGGDRFGGQRRGYSAESVREATQALLDDQWAWYHAGRSHF